jgi:TfoX/Sxy family transcriptional regulator of competence genes
MSTREEFIQFVCDQISGCGAVRYRKMFGEYMVYVNDKPILLVCDDTVFVKMHSILEETMLDAERGIPYKGAKEHYILDIDDAEFSQQIVNMLEPITPFPKKKK